MTGVVRYIALSLLALSVSLAAVCQPIATWVSKVHDFGVFDEASGRQSCEMRVVNTGDAPLIISRVQPTCGCTAGDFPRSPIAPGDTAVITLTYNPTNRAGQFEKDVYVYTNAMPARHVVKIRGNAIPTASTLDKQYPVNIGGLRLSRQILPLGEVQRTGFRLGYISGYNSTHDTIVIHSRCDASWLRIDAIPDTVAPAGTVTLTMRLDGLDAPEWGLNTTDVAVEASKLDDEVVATGSIEVTGVVLDDFKRLTADSRANPPTLVVDDRIETDSTGRGKMTVKNNGRGTLEIRRLWSDDPALTLTVDRRNVSRGGKATINVTVDKQKINGEVLNTSFTVITNDPERQVSTVRVVGILK